MLALEVKGLAYTQRRLNNSKGEQKSPEFLALNPRGHVPVLTEDETIVCETLAILAYLDATIPAPPLFGTTPLETARIWQAISDCDGHLRDPVVSISRPLFRGKAQEFSAQISDAAETVRDELELLETRLRAAPWLAGDALSAADLTVFPVLMQLCRAADQEDATALDLRLTPLHEYFPSLDAWRLRMEGLDGFPNAYPPHWK